MIDIMIWFICFLFFCWIVGWGIPMSVGCIIKFIEGVDILGGKVTEYEKDFYAGQEKIRGQVFPHKKQKFGRRMEL